MGEGWPKIMIKSSAIWNNPHNPQVVFRVGNKGDVGHLEMQDIVFETVGYSRCDPDGMELGGRRTGQSWQVLISRRLPP